MKRFFTLLLTLAIVIPPDAAMAMELAPPMFSGSVGAPLSGGDLSLTHYAPRAMFFVPQTWHIRLDGGSNTRCTGLVNAPDPGSGSAQPCAYNHPYQMMNFAGNWAALVAGDTIEFDDAPTNTTPYYMGEQNGGLGSDWHTALGGICPAPNSPDTSGVACILPQMLDNITIKGQNFGSCHQSNHAGLDHPTVLTGINGIFWMFNVEQTTGVTISCIEVTQADTCTSAGVGWGPGQCTSSSNYIKSTGLNLSFDPGGGIFPVGPANFTLTDFAAVGLQGSGVQGSHTSGTFTGSDIYLIGNGQFGWNGDAGTCGNNCESVGTMNLDHLDIEWNGCMAVKPYNIGISPETAPNAFNYCYGQNTTGNGDGFVLLASGAFTLNINHSKFKYNTQDGFDGAHVSDDPTTAPVMNITNSWSEGNAGQQYKMGAGGNSGAINNVMINNCKILSDSTAFPNNPVGWTFLDAGDDCRAGGDGWNITSGLATIVTFENNTSVGYGNVMWDFTCSGFVANCNAATIVFKNNLNKGYPDPSSGTLASGIYLNTGIISSQFTSPSNNLWNTMHTGCPDGAINDTTGVQCGDPLLVSESNINHIDPNITASSPAIGNGIHIAAITTDYNGNATTNPPSIGALVFNGGASTVATPTPGVAPGTYTSAQSVTLSTVTAGATICYTMGTSPANPSATVAGTCDGGSTTYSGAISVPVTTTIKALGTKSGDTNSSVFSGLYTITLPATPTVGISGIGVNLSGQLIINH